MEPKVKHCEAQDFIKIAKKIEKLITQMNNEGFVLSDFSCVKTGKLKYKATLIFTKP